MSITPTIYEARGALQNPAMPPEDMLPKAKA